MILQRFESIVNGMEKAAHKAGRNVDEITLLAVSKGHGPEQLAMLAHDWHGIKGPYFGESYVQEADLKIPQVEKLLVLARAKSKPEIQPVGWHFVGHLQSRKAKEVFGRYHLVHSLDSLSLAAAFEKEFKKATLVEGGQAPVQKTLIQVNIGGEPQKSGVMPDALEAFIESVLPMGGISIEGLMCLPPFEEDPEKSRPWFFKLRNLAERMKKLTGLELPHLSMGMSDDFSVAIEEGATIIRVGTAIFGPRQVQQKV